MCGFIVTNRKMNIDLIMKANDKIKFRGPDLCNIEPIGQGITVIHNLLSMTGKNTKQPIHKNGVSCVFNGEIYNYKDFGQNLPSDAYAILESYEHVKGEDFSGLDGEFAICLIDFEDHRLSIASDSFGIKPLYYSFENKEFGVASYKSALVTLGFKDIKRLSPNTLICYCLSQKKQEYISENVFNFDLNQYKDTYEDWCEAFLKACEKRFCNVKHDIIVPLSSGMDSGAICVALNELGVKYITYSYAGRENSSIIHQRRQINGQNSYFMKVLSNTNMFDNCEQFFYGDNSEKQNINGFDDPGAKGLYALLRDVKRDNPNIRILASGQGADEIITNIEAYRFGGSNPREYPEFLEDVFPWNNFYEGANSSYLNKEECITGCFGIEGRYPFLDKQVVQEFLSLTSDLKNVKYKAPIAYFLEKYKYPYNREKVGFNPL